MSFLRYFFTKSDAHPSAGEGVESIESNRKRLAAVRKRHFKQGAGIDHGKRIAGLEAQLADAALVIETMIELLEERMGLSREEIEERLEKLSAVPPVSVELVPDSSDTPAPAPAPPVLSTGDDEKERFQPKRRWRDARGKI